MTQPNVSSLTCACVRHAVTLALGGGAAKEKGSEAMPKR